jgi:hypothetical protein
MVDKYPDAHFFLDEIPTLGRNQQRYCGIKIISKKILKV